MPINYFKEIYEYIPDGIIVMTSERKIGIINPVGRQLTGWQVSDVVPFCSIQISFLFK